MLAYCGIECSECLTLLATKANDDRERAKVAETWSEKFGWKLTAQDINCNGCTQGGMLFGFCRDCPVKPCCEEKGLEHCAQCPDLGCEKVQLIWSVYPDLKEKMEKLRQSN
jgi:hypothetical protein